jgi:alkylhydroperoxidase family enzyme
VPRFEPIPSDQLSDEANAIFDAGRAIGVYPDLDGERPAPLRVMAYNSTVLKATAAQAAAMWKSGVLDDRIKELVRIRSAQVNGCDACASRVKDPSVGADDVACLVAGGDDGLDQRETLAVALVGDLAWRPDAVDEKRLGDLLGSFSPAEVVELAYHVCVMLGQHRFHHLFRSFEEGEPLVSFEPGLVDGVEVRPPAKTTTAAPADG